MKNPRVLVASPTYSSMEYCIREFIDSLKEIDYDNYSILIVDNSKSEDFFKKLEREKKIIAVRDDTKEERNVNRLVSSRNKILEYAKNEGYDFVLMMDSDVIPPREIIKELLSSNKEVISGLYYGDFKISGKIREMPVCWKLFTKEQFEELRKRDILPEYAKTREDVRRHITDGEIEMGGVEEVYICSPGCMLLSRKIFEKIRYSSMLSGDGILYGDDIAFLDKIRTAGFKIHCNTKVKCRHLYKNKIKKGEHPMYN